MIYLVSNQAELFDSDVYERLSVQDSINMICSWNKVQYDSETKGVDAHIAPVLCAQFGNKKADVQIVVDATTVDLRQYKPCLEERLVIGQNLLFDLPFLYNYGIHPTNVYDTMIAEQVLYLGYPSVLDGGPSMSLAAIAERRLNIYISKEVRGQIIWRGLDTEVIKYAAGDVKYLEDIMWSQINDARKKDCVEAIRLECAFVPVLAYVIWCGIRIDTNKWQAKMENDNKVLASTIAQLNKFVVDHDDKKFIKVDTQGDLFLGFDTTPKCAFQWKKPGTKAKNQPIVNFIKSLGFNTKIKDKKTGLPKDSIELKVLKKQKGINDDFLNLYIEYSEALKVCTSYGIAYLNAINPYTLRIHTQFKQIGADTGRITCNNGDDNDDNDIIKINPDLAKLKGFPLKTDDINLKCGYPNIQTLPADKITRECFIPNDGNVFCSCDWSAIESRLGADIYQEESMIKEFLQGSGDMHSLCAYMVYKDEIPRDIDIKDIKEKFPKLRKEVKPIEFSQQFGGSAHAIQNAMGCTIEEAEAFAKAYNEGFKGIAKYKKKGSKFVRQHGYILLNPITGHKTYWWDHDKWLKVEQSHDEVFWIRYRRIKEKKQQAIKDGQEDPLAYCTEEEKDILREVSFQAKVGAKWDRKALNSVTQGTGCICLKRAATDFYHWVIEHDYFGKVLMVDLVHDEICIEYPKELTSIADVLRGTMVNAAAIYCKSVPIPAEAEVSDHWVH